MPAGLVVGALPASTMARPSQRAETAGAAPYQPGSSIASEHSPGQEAPLMRMRLQEIPGSRARESMAKNNTSPARTSLAAPGMEPCPPGDWRDVPGPGKVFDRTQQGGWQLTSLPRGTLPNSEPARSRTPQQGDGQTQPARTAAKKVRRVEAHAFPSSNREIGRYRHRYTLCRLSPGQLLARCCQVSTTVSGLSEMLSIPRCNNQAASSG